MVDRYLRPSKASLSAIEWYLIAIVWVLYLLMRYIIYLPFVTVAFLSV